VDFDNLGLSELNFSGAFVETGSEEPLSVDLVRVNQVGVAYLEFSKHLQTFNNLALFKE